MGYTAMVTGDAAQAVEVLVERSCSGCHGMDGNSATAEFPNLAGQQASYLLREMQDYKEGRRQNEAMAPIMSALSTQDMQQLAAYFARQTPVPGTVNKPGLLALGQRIYLEGNDRSGVPSCEGCHEENGEGSKKFPRLAGQHVPYTLDQIAQYASGQRNNGIRVMRTIAQRLTPEEAEAVAEYMASLK